MIEAVFETCIEQLNVVKMAEAGAIRQAARLVAEALAEEKPFYWFGSGHSTFIARDAYWRAGGLAPALVIPDPMMGDAERVEGFAALLLAHYELQPGSVLVVISNSGINPLPIEMALEAKDQGLKVVAVTCREHSEAITSRHCSGKKLMDLADVVINTHGVPGDAALTLPGSKLRVAPTSTIIGAAIIQAIVAQASAFLLEWGRKPPVIVSANLPEGDAWNRELAVRYRSSMVRYEVPTADASRTPAGR